jgi:hypothetical protein
MNTPVELDSALGGIVVWTTLVGSFTPLLLQQTDIRFTRSTECRLLNTAQFMVAPILRVLADLLATLRNMLQNGIVSQLAAIHSESGPARL